MQLLGNRLARTQAGVPVREEEAGAAEDSVMQDGAAEGPAGSGIATPVAGDKPAAGGGGGGGGGAKGKKKKGKR
jgi:hypothetical protein